MRKSLSVAALVITMLLSWNATAQTTSYGYTKAKITEQPDCPVRIARAGVQDSEKASGFTRGMASLDRVMKTANGKVVDQQTTLDGSVHAGSVRYDVQIEALRDGVVAIEVAWSAVNAFEEPKGSRTAPLDMGKALKEKAKKTVSENAARISEDQARFEIRVMRVRFEDGTTWVAPVP
jgi:hypothetical protein